MFEHSMHCQSNVEPRQTPRFPSTPEPSRGILPANKGRETRCYFSNALRERGHSGRHQPVNIRSPDLH